MHVLFNIKRTTHEYLSQYTTPIYNQSNTESNNKMIINAYICQCEGTKICKMH